MTLNLGKKPAVAIAALLGAAVIPTANALAQQCVEPHESIVSWWDGDELAYEWGPGYYIPDIHGSNDSQFTSSVTQVVPGKVGNAFDIAGLHPIDLPNMTFGPNVTIEAWIYIENLNTNFQSIFGLCNDPAGAQVCSGGDYAMLNLRVRQDGGIDSIFATDWDNQRFLHQTPGGVLAPGQWYHIATSINTVRQAAVMYVNGLRITAGANDVGGGGIERFINTTPAAIGGLRISQNANPTGHAEAFSGKIDEISVYNNYFTHDGIGTGDPEPYFRAIYEADHAGKCKTPPNEKPVAVAGDDQTIRTLGETVNLDGSGSFDDNTSSENLSYAWQFDSKPASSSASLSGANTATPSFVTDASGVYDVALIVTDDDATPLASDPDIATISTENLSPTADAGSDQAVLVGDVVQLSGSGSTDPEDDTLNYDWSLFDRPAGSMEQLIGSHTRDPFFIPDVAGGYSASLTVSDALGEGTPDVVQVTAIEPNDAANEQITQASATIVNLPKADVTTKGNKGALTNFLRQASDAIAVGDTAEAIKKLNDALKRTDGCYVNGTPDGNGKGRDWITNCVAQLEAYDSITAAIDALS